MTAESLNLVGDGDEVDLLEAWEAAFGIMVGPEETAPWRTVGDAARTFEALASPGGTDEDAWAIQRAFYRIRDAIGADRIRPSTPLASLGEMPKLLVRRIERESGLSMPPLPPTAIGQAAWLLCAAAVVGLLIGWVFKIWLAIAASLVVAVLPLVWLVVFEPGAFPAGVVTVGDLARRAAPLNLGILRREGAGRGLGIWETVAAIAADVSCIDIDRIRPETLLFPPR